ncbi:hypothetical protein ACIRPX_45545 [Streptomyces sp. NPDC101225]|uniref:hypothetical protein n=1 Tax=Streptomyces sp. NPDC101225 TaxID=3366135 RepID=UPI0037FFC8B1
MASVDEVREDLMRLLDRSENWLNGLRGIPGLAISDAEIDEQVRDLRGQRGRALSALLNVGLLGRQSSGKSFLISGLQNGLRYVRFEQQDGGYTEQYIGILPSSPTPTTACPSTVRPVHADSGVHASERGLLRVRFVGHPEGEWAEIGTNLAPSVVAAYGAADGDRANRMPDHYQLEVEQIELLIENALLPAKFFDLPGAESPNLAYEQIMRNAWAEADCFIYVTQGTATLTTGELKLVTDLYNHYLQTGKPVLWVLTGIDRANQLGNDNRPGWQSAVETNNAYLHERFALPDGTGATFIGEGFLPVSPAWEAQGDLDEAEGNERAAQRNRSNSRMAALRDRLTELIENGTGQYHLRKIADEAFRLVRARHRDVTDVLDARQLSVEELTTERDNLRRRLHQTERSAERIRAELENELNRYVRATERLFGELKDVFHQELDALIDSGNLGAEHLAEVKVHQTRKFNEWMTGEQGPATVWTQHVEALDAQARNLLHSELGGDEHSARLVSETPIEPGDLLSSLDERRRYDVYGMVQAGGAAISIVSALGSVGAALMTSLSLSAVTGGVALVGVGAVAAAKVLKVRKSVVDQARDQRKNQLDQEAQQARTDFATVARQQGQVLADAVDSHIAEHRQRLRNAQLQIEERIEDPDISSSLELVAQLKPVDRAGRAIVNDLMDFSSATQGVGVGALSVHRE